MECFLDYILLFSTYIDNIFMLLVKKKVQKLDQVNLFSQIVSCIVSSSSLESVEESEDVEVSSESLVELSESLELLVVVELSLFFLYK